MIIREQMAVDSLVIKLMRAHIKASDELIGDLCGVLHELVDSPNAGLTPIDASAGGWLCDYCEQDTDDPFGNPDHLDDCPLPRARRMLLDIETPTDDTPAPPAGAEREE